MKTYCVTGGAGFIGSHVCEKLLTLGHRVVVIDNFSDFYDYQLKIRNVIEMTEGIGHTDDFAFLHKEEDLKHIAAMTESPRFKLSVADIRNPDDLEAAFAGESIDAVIHLAAMAGVRPSIENPLLYEEVNVKGTLNVLEAMRKNGIRKWLCASSSSVYGNQEKVPFSEQDFVDRAVSPYAATKKSCEVLGHTYHHLYDIDTMMLRFFTVYGPRQRPDLAIRKFTSMLEQGEELTVYGDGSTRRDYTYIGDIVEGILGALRFVEEGERVYEIVNLGTNRTITLLEMVRCLEQETGTQARIRFLPDQPGDVKQTFADVARAHQLFGYDPMTEFAAGIHQFVNWYRSESL